MLIKPPLFDQYISRPPIPFLLHTFPSSPFLGCNPRHPCPSHPTPRQPTTLTKVTPTSTQILLDSLSLASTNPPVRYHVVTSSGSFVLLNFFRVESKGIGNHHLVYRSKNHKYDFMRKRTSLELGSELRYVLGKC